jgi:hypothetical protein
VHAAIRTAALQGFGKGMGAFVVNPDYSYFLTGECALLCLMS